MLEFERMLTQSVLSVTRYVCADGAEDVLRWSKRHPDPRGALKRVERTSREGTSLKYNGDVAVP